MIEPFVISRGVETDTPTIQVMLTDNKGNVGRGEACGIDYQGETPETMMAQIAAVEAAIAAGITRSSLLDLLPNGGARFAIDSALWDLEAKRDGTDPFTMAGLRPDPVNVDVTIGIRPVAEYETAARKFADYSVLKVKVDASDPIACIANVRKGAPKARMIIDPNQSWSVEMVKALGPQLKALGVALLEQPIKLGDEPGLDGHVPEVPLCADELIDSVADLAKARGRFQLINIKLDKCGGLTAGLALADEAQRQGFGLMIGCMAGSSLSMAPGMVLAQRCAFVDLDGPLLHAEDIDHGFTYVNGMVAQPYQPRLWG
jgi:L-alanine-DL-glutamate epimerase-like enolase superfamily enzyme